MEKIRKNSFEPGKEILGNADRVDRVSVNCSGSPPNLGCIGPHLWTAVVPFFTVVI